MAPVGNTVAEIQGKNGFTIPGGWQLSYAIKIS
jgi:hypothetical protein